MDLCFDIDQGSIKELQTVSSPGFPVSCLLIGVSLEVCVTGEMRKGERMSKRRNLRNI